jgi:hypothetical protein
MMCKIKDIERKCSEMSDVKTFCFVLVVGVPGACIWDYATRGCFCKGCFTRDDVHIHMTVAAGEAAGGIFKRAGLQFARLTGQDRTWVISRANPDARFEASDWTLQRGLISR